MEDKLQDEFTPNSQLIAKQVEEMNESAAKSHNESIIKKIEALKEATRETGTFKYDVVYDEVIANIK